MYFAKKFPNNLPLIIFGYLSALICSIYCTRFLYLRYDVQPHCSRIETASYINTIRDINCNLVDVDYHYQREAYGLSSVVFQYKIF